MDSAPGFDSSSVRLERRFAEFPLLRPEQSGCRARAWRARCTVRRPLLRRAGRNSAAGAYSRVSTAYQIPSGEISVLPPDLLSHMLSGFISDRSLRGSVKVGHRATRLALWMIPLV